MKERPTVLLVDDDPSTAHVLPTHLAELADVEVLTARDGREAAEALLLGSVDVVVTRLELPVVDGLTLLAHIHNRHPGLPAVVLARSSPGTDVGRIARFGGICLLGTPCSAATVATAVRTELDGATRGRSQGIGLAAIAQVVEAAGRSCLVDVTAGDRRGRLHFAGGRLVGADTDAGARGEAAAREILGWPVGRLDVRRGGGETLPPLKTTLHQLLIEAALIDDLEPPRSPGTPGADAAATRTAVMAEGTRAAPPSPAQPAARPAERTAASRVGAATAVADGDGAADDVATDRVVVVAEETERAPAGAAATGGDLGTAIARLSDRVRAAERALAAISSELASLHEARRRLEREQAERERHSRELERFKDEVTRMARSVLEKVDGLFVQEPRPPAGSGGTQEGPVG